MRWLRFEHGGKPAMGLVNASGQVERMEGDLFGETRHTGEFFELDSLKLLIPFEPKTFYAAGLNYKAHVTEAAHLLGKEPEFPPNADIGYRANNSLCAHDDDIVIPADASEKLQYEGELVVVIGKQAKHLSEENALSCVFGYTIGNDFSERTWQRGDRTLWRGKNTDTFAPMGPWIETDLNLDEQMTNVRVNGEQTVSFKTNDMLFSIEHFIARMTKYVTLYPGDMIWMGTDGTSPNLVDGDVVEIDITSIGTLRNRVVRASA